MIPRRVARRTARRTTRRVSRRQGMFDQPDYPETTQSEQLSSTEELEKLFELKEKGAISEEEYERRKKEIL